MVDAALDGRSGPDKDGTTGTTEGIDGARLCNPRAVTRATASGSGTTAGAASVTSTSEGTERGSFEDDDVCDASVM